MSTASPQILAAFHQLDTNRDGMIQPAELAAVLKKLNATSFNDDSIKTLFEAADADKNGMIDLEEFVNWLFHDAAKGEEMLDALNRDRMAKMSATLLSIDLPWMKLSVDQNEFSQAVATLFRKEGSLFSVGAEVDTLPAAHALLSVDEADIPDCACIEAADGGLLKDASVAPLLYASLAAGCKQLQVINAEWGERTVSAMEHGLAGACVERLSFCNAGIRDEKVIVQLLDSIDGDMGLNMVDLSNNVVGMSGLRALHEALLSCPKLLSVYLYNIGPWTDGDGLGCRRNSDAEDVLLLEEIRQTIMKRGGQIQNEAFNEGDICNYAKDTSSVTGFTPRDGDASQKLQLRYSGEQLQLHYTQEYA